MRRSEFWLLAAAGCLFCAFAAIERDRRERRELVLGGIAQETELDELRRNLWSERQRARRFEVNGAGDVDEVQVDDEDDDERGRVVPIEQPPQDSEP